MLRPPEDIDGIADHLDAAAADVRWRRDLRFWWVEIGRLVRFGITGVVATIVYAAVTLILSEVCRVGAVTASVIGYFASAGISYYGHMRFSFDVGPDHKTYLWRFLTTSALSFALNIFVTWATTHVFGYSARVSVVLVSILVPATNYVCNRFWVFRPGLKPSLKLIANEDPALSVAADNNSHPS